MTLDTTSTVDFLSQLRKLNINLWLEHDTLRFQAPQGVMTARLRAEITQKKTEIIAFLKQANLNSQAIQEPIDLLPRDGRELPVSFSQESLWFFDQLFPKKPRVQRPQCHPAEGPIKSPGDKFGLEHCGETT